MCLFVCYGYILVCVCLILCMQGAFLFFKGIGMCASSEYLCNGLVDSDVQITPLWVVFSTDLVNFM